MFSKIDRAKYGPGVFEVTLGVILSVALGVLLAFVYLVLKPVQVVKVLPKEQPAYTVYYIEGSTNSSRGKQWMRKKQLFVEGSTVSLTEDELNAWIAASTTPPKAAANPQPKNAESPPPNFRIHDGNLQIGLPCTLSAFGYTVQLIAQTQGHFDRKGSGFVYSPDRVYLGSCPLQRLVGFGGSLIKRFVKMPDIPEDISNAWKNLTDVAIEGNSLKLTMP
ncbi:MAG TPA: hypothetical protein VKC60_10435 [Opitutaceae bacterium]|nr:hypothetical protein [Opitutaceae bacterium]